MGRRHGCESPHNVPQVMCIIMFFFLLSGFYTLYVPVLLEAWQQALTGALYSLAVAAAATLFVAISLSDPTEYGTSEPEEPKEGEEQYYCVLCQVHVKKASKHCRSCDRCVEGFDHHCKWLNNCVGAKNYRSFFALVLVTCAMIAQQLAVGAYLLAISVQQPEAVGARLAELYGSGLSLTGFRALQGALLALSLPPVLLLGELLCFHMLLIAKGMSTYEYIMAQRELKMAAEEAQAGGASRPRPWVLRMFAAGAVSPEAHTPARVKVGLSPLALLKMKRSNGSAGCGCKSSPLGRPHGVSPLPQGSPATALLASPGGEEPPTEPSLRKHLFPPGAVVEQAGDPLPPALDLGKLAVVPPFPPPREEAKQSRLALPPINPPQPRKAFHP